MPIQKQESQIDLDDLFEDEDFKGPNTVLNKLYQKLMRNNLSTKDLNNLNPGERVEFSIYLINSIKIIFRQGSKNLNNILKINKPRFEKIINFISTLDDEQSWFIFQSLENSFLISTQIDKHPKYLEIINRINNRRANRNIR